MSTDLLFSILPREGKVPIAHDSQKVAKIDRQEVLRALSDKEKELKGEEKTPEKSSNSKMSVNLTIKKLLRKATYPNTRNRKGPSI